MSSTRRTATTAAGSTRSTSPVETVLAGTLNYLTHLQATIFNVWPGEVLTDYGAAFRQVGRVNVVFVTDLARIFELRDELRALFADLYHDVTRLQESLQRDLNILTDLQMRLALDGRSTVSIFERCTTLMTTWERQAHMYAVRTTAHPHYVRIVSVLSRFEMINRVSSDVSAEVPFNYRRLVIAPVTLAPPPPTVDYNDLVRRLEASVRYTESLRTALLTDLQTLVNKLDSQLFPDQETLRQELRFQQETIAHELQNVLAALQQYQQQQTVVRTSTPPRTATAAGVTDDTDGDERSARELLDRQLMRVDAQLVQLKQAAAALDNTQLALTDLVEALQSSTSDTQAMTRHLQQLTRALNRVD